MWQMVGILAELERSLIQERTKAGRAAAEARGVKMGRKPKLSPQHVAHARKLLDQGECPAHVAQLLNVSWRTVERALRSSKAGGLDRSACQYCGPLLRWARQRTGQKTASA